MDYPKYQSHKEVSAARITAVDAGADGSVTIHLEPPFDSIIIPHHLMKHKPKPEAGWYLVVYADGFMSFSPAKAFEEGYTRIDAPAMPAEEPTAELSKQDLDEEEDEEEPEAAIALPEPVGVGT